MPSSFLAAVVRSLATVNPGGLGASVGGVSAGPDGACVGSFCVGGETSSSSTPYPLPSSFPAFRNSTAPFSNSSGSAHPINGTRITSPSPSVTLLNGTLAGGICSTNQNAAFFKGIPYAKAPWGDLRFAAPEPFDSKYNGGRLNATQNPASCIQFGSVGSEGGFRSEDCLYLNVWTPVNSTSNSSLPVRVFLYGGSNLVGGIADPLYDGCNVATDAIMVTMNYRLGPFGFLGLESAGIGGNQGIQDITQGLQWVQDNIRAFGGDSNKVMLHGESAGAIDAFTVATTEQASNLISALISESGGGRDCMQKSTAQKVGKNFAKALGCGIDDLQCLRQKSVDEVIEAVNNQPELNTKSLASIAIDSPADQRYGSFIDGKVITKQPAEQGARVPAIFGTNAYEGTLFAHQQFSNPASVTAEDFNTFLRENFGNQARRVERAYPLASFNSTKYPIFYAISQIITDAAFKCPASRALNTASSKDIDVWAYRFSTTPKCGNSPNFNQSDINLLGATHGAEITFVLNSTCALPLPALPGQACEMSPAEKDIASFLTRAWTEIAASQKPVRNASDWPAYGGANHSRGVNFDDKPSAGPVDFSLCDFWKDINRGQVKQGKNGTNVTSLEGPQPYWRLTTTESGVYTTTQTSTSDGQVQDITQTLNGTHTLTITVNDSAAATTELTTSTQTTTIEYATVETSGGVATTVTAQSLSPIAVTYPLATDGAAIEQPTPSITYTAPNGDEQETSPAPAAATTTLPTPSNLPTPSVLRAGSSRTNSPYGRTVLTSVVAMLLAMYK